MTPHPAWPAPTPTGALSATVVVPGSKSLSNRYLVLAALADGPSRLRGVLTSRDTALMAAALTSLGARVRTEGTDWVVEPGPVRGSVQVDVGLAGTVMRFLPTMAAMADGPVLFDGDPEAYARPVGPLLDALRQLGVTVDDHRAAGYLPFTVHGLGEVPGGRVDVDASASSQFVSGLLLSAARFRDGLTLRHTGPTLPSLPHIEMTVATLRGAGVTVDDSRPEIWQVGPSVIAGRDVHVEPDLSNAAPFLAAALAVGGEVRVPGWPGRTTQPGAMLPEIFTAMGGDVHLDGDVLTVRGTGQVHGVDLDLRAAGELAPTVAALAALGDSPTRLRGIAHLRGHETDRLTALATELTRVGCQAEQTSDGLVITPRPMRAALWRSYADHRMATAGALVGLVVPGIEVEDVATTAKTLPDFVGMWTAMLGDTP
ncbi:MAG: 3-phosphoshikimate 1-carboxyvinyltransferase [Micrococcales bacterium]|nr:3-phosphoshikimate 1-carboxyvinyltransferase [Micrococcales bacterium]